jgi:hypothetical protein
METDELEKPNAFPLPVFCRRNNIGRTSAYRAHEAGLLKLTRVFGKTVVTIEDEAEFRRLAREGKLVWPKKNDAKQARMGDANRREPAARITEGV